MNCPKCQTVMREREKGDIVIDICPNCQGIFLDHGEMDKLIAVEERVFEKRGWSYDDDDDDDEDRRYRGSGHDRGDYRGGDNRGSDNRGRVQSYEARGAPQYGQQPKKKKSFLSSMFENFGEGGGED